jgi:hypothetical protein
MCTPLAAVAIGAAQTASSIIGQRQQAQMQAQAQATASSQERQRYLAEVSAMRTQQQQEMVARAQRIQEASKRAMEAKARATVAAGESVQALLGDFSRQEAQYSFSEQQQAEMTDVNRQIQLQEAGIGFSRNMLRINRPIEQPDYIGSVFGGIQTGLSNYSVMKNAGLI